ncbi:MAG: DUF3108 domain-containing protein [Candidatus Omnitrophica bacterium]|nr:DUF3108 domain-containing protein [Candidatus Omnitrophota bacterium]MCM8770308.1 DUF3108 domain-containing protein [Candidatus Omnitrophota bacterium]
MCKKGIRKIILFVFLIIAVLILWQLYQNRPEVIIKRLSRGSHLNRPNPELIYQIKFLGVLPIGQAVIYPLKSDTYQGKEIYFLQAEAFPYAYIKTFLKFKAKIQSYINRKDYLPILFKQEIEVGEKTDVKEVIYDQENHIMTLRKEQRTILPFTYEPLSLILNLRQMDFSKGREFDLNINTNQKNYGMQGFVLTKQQTSQGDFWILRSQISRRDKNNPYHRSKVTFYFLDNQERTPLLIKVFASGAYIVARLIDVR